MNTTLVLTSSSRGSSSSASPDKKKIKTKLMFPCPYCTKHYVDIRAHIRCKHFSEHYKTKSARVRVPTTDLQGNVSWSELKSAQKGGVLMEISQPKKTGIAQKGGVLMEISQPKKTGIVCEYCMKHFSTVSNRKQHIKQVHHIVSSKSNPAEHGDHPAHTVTMT